MIRRYNKNQDRGLFFRRNEQIRASSLRVLDKDGKQIGILGRDEALRKAREEGLDLVEVAPKAQPPVGRIIDFNKFLYQQGKKRREEKRKAKASETKEVRLGPFMDNHDLEVMVRRGREFLENNHKVRLVVKFVGRQIVHPEFGKEVLQKVLNSLSDISRMERDPHFEGKQLIAIIVPERKKQKNEEENQKISKKAV